MKSMWQQYGPKSQRQHFSWSAVSLVLAYVIGSMAINSGSLGQYFLTLLLFYFFVHFLISGFRTSTSGKSRNKHE
ncbi:MAG: hypothetical protein JWS12_864 [Candidatus Saccharibacteria bacterium]|nr:hypothetical protein [Candidatus Saccharibacteria bacterium]